MHRKIEFVTVNLNFIKFWRRENSFSPLWGKNLLRFSQSSLPNPENSVFQRLLLRIKSGIRLQSVLSGYPAGRKISYSVHLYTRCYFTSYPRLQTFFSTQTRHNPIHYILSLYDIAEAKNAISITQFEKMRIANQKQFWKSNS